MALKISILTGNPQITFFKVVYRRHTNFAMESIEQTFNGTANFGKKVQCTISRNGDLIHRVYLQATLPQVVLQSTDGSGAQFRWLNWVGHNLIADVTLRSVASRLISTTVTGSTSGMSSPRSLASRPVTRRWWVTSLNS
jgi:hypothetical protein